MKEEKIEECIDSATGQETQLAILRMVVRALYTAHSIRNVLHYDAIRKMLESYRSYQRNWRKVAEHRPELDGTEWRLLETTRIVQVVGSVIPYSYPYHHV